MTTPPINYNPNFPLPSDSYGSWQPVFLNNFIQLSNAFSVNHVPLTAVSNAGNHTVIQLLERIAPQQTAVTEFSVYAKDAPGQTDQIYMRYQKNGTEFQFTNYQIYTLPTANTYFTFLPGRIICYFGLLPPRTTLALFPQVAKNIMSINITPAQNTNFVVSTYSITTVNGIITTLGASSAFNNYYVVLANI